MNKNNNNVHIKLECNGEFRRFLFQEKSYASLLDTIMQITCSSDPVENVTLKYLDEEDEWVTFSSDIELETGISLSKDILRLKLETRNSETDDSETKVDETEELSICLDELPPRVRNKWKRKLGHSADTDDSDIIVPLKELPPWLRRKAMAKLGNEDDSFSGKKFTGKRGRHCGRGRRFGGHGRRFGGKGRRGRGKWANTPSNSDDSSTSTSTTSEEMTLADIKASIASLKEEMSLYKNKIGKVNENFKELKKSIQQLRQNGASVEEICENREKLNPLKDERKHLRTLINNTRSKLRSMQIKRKEALALEKSDTKVSEEQE